MKRIATVLSSSLLFAVFTWGVDHHWMGLLANPTSDANTIHYPSMTAWLDQLQTLDGMQENPLVMTLALYAPIISLAIAVIWNWHLIQEIRRRKQAETKLRKSAAHQRAVMAAFPDLIMRVSRDGIYQEFLASPTFQVMGDLKSWLGTHVADNFPVDLAKQRLDTIDQALETHSMQVYEQTLSIQGDCQTEEVRVVPYSDHEALLVVRDITNRKKAELDLATSEAQSRALLAAIPDLMFRVDSKGIHRGLVSAAPGFDEFPEGVDLTGRPMREFLPREVVARHLHYLKKALATEELQVYEQTLQVGDRLQHEEVRVVKSGDDEVLFVIRNITERKQTEEKLRDSEQRLRHIIEVAPFPIMIHADDGEVLQINSIWTELTGYCHKDIPSTQIWAEKAYGDRAAEVFESAIAGAYASTSRWEKGDFHITTHDGRHRIWQFSSTSLGQLPDGRQAAISMAVDMTQQRQADLALRENEQRFRHMAANVPGAIFKYVLHPDGADQIIYMSPGCYDLWGINAEAVVEDANVLWNVVHPEDRSDMQTSILESARTLQPWFWQWRIITPSGTLKWLEAAGRPERCEDGDVVWDALIMDVSDRIDAQQQLKHDALHDRLTGLPNRSLLMERLDLALKRTKRKPGSSFAVLFLDLDNFKVVNDSLGHLVGDELLLAVANCLTTFIRETDIAARLGGDEFVILLEDIDDIEGVIRVAEQILTTLRSPLKLAERDVFTSTSIGIVLSTPQHKKADDLLRDADLAMYRAKHNGRGQYALFNPTMHLRAVERLNLENDLRKALEYQEFELYYQPVIHLETLSIRGFEALLRWQHPERGVVPSNAFIKVAEETGLIIPIGQWILETACQQLADWQQQFPAHSLRMSVNLSAKQLHNQFLKELDTILVNASIAANNLVLEITEGMLVQNMKSASLLLEQIQAKGIRLSIDDFGTGYSSLSYLHQLPAQSLKIDRAFVNPSAADARNKVIAESIIALSKLLELRAIAEGIETPGQLQWLQKLGCEFGQGFLFSPPVPVEQATSLLRERLCFSAEQFQC